LEEHSSESASHGRRSNNPAESNGGQKFGDPLSAGCLCCRVGFISVFSNPGMSLERPEIDDAKRVDPL
jgi:hypothetical protein